MSAGKGSFSAPLFFLSLAFACAGSQLGAVWPWAASAATLLVAAARGLAAKRAMSWSLASVFGYTFLVALDALFLSPAYTPAGLYFPLLLALGFLAMHGVGEDGEKGAALAALSLGVILAAWGLAQLGPLGVARAHALFETPATYAAVLNLMLVPILAAVLVGRRSWRLPAIAALLAAALFAADSRGGLLALAAGFAFAAILAFRAHLLRPRALALALALVATGWILATAVRTLAPTDSAMGPTTDAREQSSLSRLELYALSWNAWRERPLAGTGYLTFRHKLEQGRAQVPSFGVSNETWFVHNDYLQTLQELGPVGLLAFLGLALLPPLLAYRRILASPELQRPAVVVAASALAAMAVHALVDFPFYIPVCLLLYGALLGALDRRLTGPALFTMPVWRSTPWVRAARTAVFAIAAVVLLRPVAAEAAAQWGLRKFAGGDGQRAAFWLGAAQRVDSRDWRYHWYAGQFWDAQAADSGKREAARLAADAYAAGFDANPLEVKNLLGKISVHRRYRAMLDAPADRATLQSWLSQAEALAPLNSDVRREREMLGPEK